MFETLIFMLKFYMDKKTYLSYEKSTLLRSKKVQMLMLQFALS